MKDTFVVVLAPRDLVNPDTDLGAQFPHWIEKHSLGAVQALGWGYSLADEMHFFFTAEGKEHGLQKICLALASELVLGNDLSSSTIAWRAADSGSFIMLYPSEFVGRIVEDIDA